LVRYNIFNFKRRSQLLLSVIVNPWGNGSCTTSRTRAPLNLNNRNNNGEIMGSGIENKYILNLYLSLTTAMTPSNILSNLLQ